MENDQAGHIDNLSPIFADHFILLTINELG